MNKTIKLSKKDTKFLNKIINLNNEFKLYKKNKNTENMYVVLYKMRVLHGVMITRLNKYSNKLYNDIGNVKSKEYYNLSVYSSLIDSAKELINKAENHLQEQVSYGNNKKMEKNNDLFQSVLSTDIENEPKESTPQLVLFFTTWCGYSRRFMPVWDELKKEMNGSNVNINIVEVDCEKDKQKCIKYNIRGYPSVKLFVDDQEIEYNGSRNVESIKKFILQYCE